MGEKTRTLYATFNISTPTGSASGRSTFEMDGDPYVPDMLSMTEVYAIERDFLRIARETLPAAVGVHLTWWTWIRQPGTSTMTFTPEPTP